MPMRRSFILYLLSCLLPVFAVAQIETPVTWTYSVSKPGAKAGETVELIFKAKIKEGWHLYASDFDPDIGPIPATFTFKPHNSYKLVGKTIAINPHKFKEEVWDNNEFPVFEKTGEFRQKVKILTDDPVIKGEHVFQACIDICINETLEFNFVFNPGPAVAVQAPDAGKPPTVKVDSLPTDTHGSTTVAPGIPDTTLSETDFDESGEPLEDENSALEFIIIAFLAGLGSLLTPCVFPIIPMTIAFFTKSETNRRKGITKAFFYGFSIIGIYTLAGLLVAIFVGPEFGYFLSTHWIPNILFFLIFIIFGAAFLGMFELTLPGWLINMMDSKSEVGGYVGIFFMAFTLVLASFSCTGPVVGSLLIEAADGSYQRPVFGMLSFSIGVALPLMIFAVFPNLIKNLPKSGGWLNSVKVVLGFIEIALAFKFLSIADQAYHWGILDRDLNIAVWIVISLLTGFYLLGKLKFSHDTDLKYIGVPRLLLAMTCFVFAVYLLPGMFGAPLKALSGYLPPLSTMDLVAPSGTPAATLPAPENDIGKVKHGDILPPLPHGLQGFFDYKEALVYSKKKNKPLFVDFTGHSCANCREMESRVWVVPEVLKRLREDFIIVSLYCDEKTVLPESEWYTGQDGKLKKSIGRQNLDLEITKYKANAQPLYVIIDSDERVYAKKARDLDAARFAEFLDKGKKGFYNRHKKP
jgi:thiol:disulfide interchange protein